MVYATDSWMKEVKLYFHWKQLQTIENDQQNLQLGLIE